MTADRTEAAAKALVMYESSGLCDEWPGPCADCDCFRDEAPAEWAARDRGRAQSVLAAADAHDRANSIARIRLDDEPLRKIARVGEQRLRHVRPTAGLAVQHGPRRDRPAAKRGAMTASEALRRYRKIQGAEGVTFADELAIARAQGEAWRDYVIACLREGIDPESPDSPGWVQP